jgi:hypothetical protein
MRVSLWIVVAFVALAVADPFSRCNDQGIFYNDINACQCCQCFSGPNCETIDNECVLIDGDGTPQLFQEYWATVGNENLLTASSFRTSYAACFDATCAIIPGGMWSLFAIFV